MSESVQHLELPFGKVTNLRVRGGAIALGHFAHDRVQYAFLTLSRFFFLFAISGMAERVWAVLRLYDFHNNISISPGLGKKASSRVTASMDSEW